MTTVNLIPDAPLLPLFISATLSVISIYRSTAWPAGILGLIVFTSIIYQLTGFMVWVARNTIGVILIVSVVAALLINSLSAIREASSMAIAILAVATMLTPYYYLSVALIMAAIATGREKGMWPMAVTYLITLTPLLVIENGLASANNPTNPEAGPIIFAQLLNLKTNMRPPLTSLNIFLPAPTTDNFRDANTVGPILSYLSGTRVYEILIPLAILAAVFSLTAIAAGMADKTLRRLAAIDGTGRLLNTITPTVVSIITPLTFALLITSLSPRHLGGYQTTLRATDTLFLLLGSLTLGAAYTAKEYATSRLERTDLARNTLKTRLETLQKITSDNHRLITRIQSKAPSIDLGQESKANEEAVSALNDVGNGVDTMERRTLEQWVAEVDEISHRVNGLPEATRLKIIAELNTLTTYTKTYNESLKEAGITKAFKTTEARGDPTTEQALADYTRLTIEIKRDANTLFGSYREAQKAYNILTSRPTPPPPLDPFTSFDSNDNEGGLRLVAEEYWLRFHHGNQADLRRSTITLLESVKRFNELQDTADLREITRRLDSPIPSDSTTILRDTETLKTAIDTALSHIESDSEKLEETIRNLAPGAPGLLGVDAPRYTKGIERLRERNRELEPTFSDTSTLLDEASTLIKAHREEGRRDAVNLIIAAHYPAAEKVIGAELRERGTIHLPDLPYADNAARIYAHLYTHSNPATHYDEENEEITEHDKLP